MNKNINHFFSHCSLKNFVIKHKIKYSTREKIGLKNKYRFPIMLPISRFQ